MMGKRPSHADIGVSICEGSAGRLVQADRGLNKR